MGLLDNFSTSKSIKNAVKTKLSTYHTLKEKLPSLPTVELYKRCVEIRPGYEDSGDRIINEAQKTGGKLNYRSVVYWVLVDEFIPSFKFTPQERENRANLIMKYIMEIIPEEL